MGHVAHFVRWDAPPTAPRPIPWSLCIKMIEPLEHCEPLSQVWFVHDYIQLRFQDRTVTVLNEPKLKLPSGRIMERSSKGFCDRLVALINQPLAESTLIEKEHFSLTFANGAEFIVPLSEDAIRGPEAVEIGTWIVFNT